MARWTRARALGALVAVGLLAPILSAQAAKTLAGDWEGTLDVGVMKLRLVTHLTRTADGVLKGTLDSPDQGARGFPIGAVSQTADEVKLDVPSLMASYSGKLDAAGERVTGQWQQGGKSWPLTFTRRAAASAEAHVSRPVTAWMKTCAIPLKTADPGSDLADMEPLRAVVGDARLVAMGEATHGTREFFQLKHRMLRFLVEHMGFTVFAIEANQPEAYAVNDYVLTGQGDPAKALAGLYFWTWNTEEVLDMIRWMRQYNADPAHVRKVKFYGFDMQTPTVATQHVVAYLRRVDPDRAERAQGVLAPLSEGKAASEYGKLPTEARQKTAAGITDLLARFDANRTQYGSRSTPVEWARVRQELRVVSQAEQMLGAPGGVLQGGFNVRDRAMADNIKWILDQEGPEAKAMLWAHNGHVSTAGYMGQESMGKGLRQAFGPQVVVFAFVFNQGSFQAVEMGKGLRTFTVGPSPAPSLDAALAAAGLPLYAVDLRHVPAGPVAGWLTSPQPTRTIGAVFSDEMADLQMSLSAAKSFDALIFVERTTAARKLSAAPAK